MDKIDCFRYFGIEVTNIRWSWAGLNESGLNRRDTGGGAVAALTIWTDQISWDKEKNVVFGVPTIKITNYGKMKKVTKSVLE